MKSIFDPINIFNKRSIFVYLSLFNFCSIFSWTCSFLCRFVVILELVQNTVKTFLSLKTHGVNSIRAWMHFSEKCIYLVLYFQAPLRGFWAGVPTDYHSYALIIMVLLSTFLVMTAKWVSRRRPTMTRKRKKLLLDQQEFVKNVVKGKKVFIFFVFTFFVWFSIFTEISIHGIFGTNRLWTRLMKEILTSILSHFDVKSYFLHTFETWPIIILSLFDGDWVH